MKKLLIALCLTVGLASPAFAADKKEPTAQQSKMATCNKEAGEKALASGTMPEPRGRSINSAVSL